GVVERAGQGVSGTVEGRTVVVGSRAFVEEAHPSEAEALAALDRAVADPGVRAFVAIGGRTAGAIVYADRLRPEAPEALAELRALGFGRLVLLSGDDARNVAAVAGQLGVAEAHADLLPAGKVAFVSDLASTGRRVLMVGDGTNDAPALSTASV